MSGEQGLEQLQESHAPSDVLDTDAAGGLIIRGGVLRFASYVGVVGLSVISASLLTRHLQPARFSQYTTVVSLVTIVALISDSGMSNLSTREYAMRHGRERDILMSDLLALRVVLTAVGVLGAALFAILAGYSTALLAGTIVAGLATIALVFQHVLTIPLTTELRLGLIALLELVRQALSVVAIVALILLGAGVFPLLAVTLLVYVVLIPATMRAARGQMSLRIELRPKNWAALLKLTVAFSIATAVGVIYVYAAQILTSLVTSGHQSGLFAASFRVFSVTTTVPGLLVSGALPLLARAARDDSERLAYALQRIFEVSLILGVAAAVAFFGGAHFVIEVIAGPTFAGAAQVLRIQAIALVASFLVAGWSFALISIKRYRSLFVVNAVALTISCALTYVLARSHGATGAAVATLCGETAVAFGSLLALTRGRPDLRPRIAVIPKVVLAAAPAVAIALLDALSSLERAVLASLVYAAIILLTRAIPSELTELIPWSRLPFVS